MMILNVFVYTDNIQASHCACARCRCLNMNGAMFDIYSLLFKSELDSHPTLGLNWYRNQLCFEHVFFETVCIFFNKSMNWNLFFFYYLVHRTLQHIAPCKRVKTFQPLYLRIGKNISLKAIKLKMEKKN